MFRTTMTIEGFDPRAGARHAGRTTTPGGSHRADRLGELCQSARARGAGLGAHQQVRRGLSRQALLRRLRVRRRRRSSWRSTAPSSCSAPTTRTCSRTRARRPTPRRYFALLQPGDTDPGHEPRCTAATSPTAPRSISPASSSAPCQYGIRRRRPARSTTTQVQRLRGRAPAEDDHRGLLRLLARHRLGALSRTSPTSVGAYFVVDMAHVAGLVAAGIYPQSRCRTLMS